jgi:hypothetical protein
LVLQELYQISIESDGKLQMIPNITTLDDLDQALMQVETFGDGLVLKATRKKLKDS